MARKSNCTAYWAGGIHGLVELAIRDDGALFERFQNRTRYGYRWSAWRATGEVLGSTDRSDPPPTRTAGFSTLRLTRPGDYLYQPKHLPSD